jgi:hypothetical protein
MRRSWGRSRPLPPPSRSAMEGIESPIENRVAHPQEPAGNG